MVAYERFQLIVIWLRLLHGILEKWSQTGGGRLLEVINSRSCRLREMVAYERFQRKVIWLRTFWYFGKVVADGRRSLEVTEQGGSTVSYNCIFSSCFRYGMGSATDVYKHFLRHIREQRWVVTQYWISFAFTFSFPHIAFHLLTFFSGLFCLLFSKLKGKLASSILPSKTYRSLFELSFLSVGKGKPLLHEN